MTRSAVPKPKPIASEQKTDLTRVDSMLKGSSRIPWLGTPARCGDLARNLIIVRRFGCSEWPKSAAARLVRFHEARAESSRDATSANAAARTDCRTSNRPTISRHNPCTLRSATRRNADKTSHRPHSAPRTCRRRYLRSPVAYPAAANSQSANRRADSDTRRGDCRHGRGGSFPPGGRPSL